MLDHNGRSKVRRKGGKEPLRSCRSIAKRLIRCCSVQNLIAENSGGLVRVGDEVEVLERARLN